MAAQAAPGTLDADVAAPPPDISPDGAPGGQVSVRTARSAGELDELRAHWERLAGDRVNAHVDLLLAVVRTEPRVMRPHVLVAERGGTVAGILVGRLETIRLPCRIGYASLPMPELRAITVVYGGLLGSADRAVLDAFVRELRQTLARGEADVVVFRELAVDSPLRQAVRDGTPLLLRDHVARRTVHRELRLPASFDGLLASLSKSTRESVRRYARKLERELGDRLSVRIYRAPDELDEIVSALADVSSRSWQGALGTAFADDDAHRERTALALERGWFRACVVRVDGRPAAFWQGLGWRGRFISGIPGFDPAYAEHRIGSYAMTLLIESLCADPAFTTFDFGFGDAEYKRRLATASWEEQTVMIFAARPKPLAANLVRTVLVGTTERVRAALVRTGLAGRVRGAWRRRMGRRA